ncbi:MAG: hypothetical protein ABSB01_13965 [Streptosporangiaceae bacterium]|jgi:superfamily II DNA or RNA helicase
MIQFVGRILRTHPGKTSIELHDYVDSQLGVLAAMWRKRSRSLGCLLDAGAADRLHVQREQRHSAA